MDGWIDEDRGEGKREVELLRTMLNNCWMSHCLLLISISGNCDICCDGTGSLDAEGSRNFVRVGHGRCLPSPD